VEGGGAARRGCWSVVVLIGPADDIADARIAMVRAVVADAPAGPSGALG